MGVVRQLKTEEEKKETTDSKTARARLSEFDWFWSEYPKKKARLDALKAWKATADIRPDTEILIAAIDRQIKSEDWQRAGGQFIPYPATWLNGARWDDE